jgi:hypothetical protein
MRFRLPNLNLMMNTTATIAESENPLFSISLRLSSPNFHSNSDFEPVIRQGPEAHGIEPISAQERSESAGDRLTSKIISDFMAHPSVGNRAATLSLAFTLSCQWPGPEFLSRTVPGPSSGSRLRVTTVSRRPRLRDVPAGADSTRPLSHNWARPPLHRRACQ